MRPALRGLLAAVWVLGTAGLCAAESEPENAPLFNVSLVKSVPASQTLKPSELAALLGIDGFPPAQQAAVLGQVRVFVSSEVVVVLPALITRANLKQGLAFQIYNRGAGPASLLWDESLFCDRRGNVKLAHKDMAVTYPKNQTPNRDNTRIEPTLLPPGLFYKGKVYPLPDFDFATDAVYFTPQPGQVGLYLAVETAPGVRRTISLMLLLQPADAALGQPAPAAAEAW